MTEVITLGGAPDGAGGDSVKTAFDKVNSNFSGVDISLDNKVDKEIGKGLSTEDYTSLEKTKLADIASEATKNRADSENADKVHTHTISQVTGLDTTLAGKASNTDPRFMDAREWSAATISQSEVEDGTAETRRAFTAQRLRQGITAWFTGISGAIGRTILGRGTAEQVRGDLGLGTAATADLTTSSLDGTAGRVLKVGNGGWMGQGEANVAPYGYPTSINDVTNQTKVIRSEGLDNGVTYFASGIHFAATNTWGRLRVDSNGPLAWVQGGIANIGTGWTSRVVLSANLLQSTGSSSNFPMSQKATTDAIANIPSVSKSTEYTVTAADKGASIDTSAGVTIPASVFAVGDVIVVTNTSDSSISITPDSGVTFRLAGSESTGLRTLAGYGVATLRMASNNVWFASGTGLS